MKIGATGVREMRSINYLMSRKLADYSHVPAKYPNIRRQSILYFNGYFAIYTSSYWKKKFFGVLVGMNYVRNVDNFNKILFFIIATS